MKHAYLIITFGDFYILRKLIQALDNPNGDIFIHLDAKKKHVLHELYELRKLAKHSKVNIYSTISVKWGDKSLVACELFLMQQAVLGNYGYYHLLSGQDFLIKPISDVQYFFEQHAGEEFLAVGSYHLNKESIDCVDKYHLLMSNRLATVRLNRLLVSIQKIVGIHRLSSKELKMFFAKGIEWASMTHSFIQCILSERCYIEKLARHSFAVDEIYKQMIYKKHADQFYLHYTFDESGNNVNRLMPQYELEVLATMHKVDWNRGNPYIYRIDDYDELIHSKCMFARKFDSNVDKKIIDKLYSYVKRG